MSIMGLTMWLVSLINGRIGIFMYMFSFFNTKYSVAYFVAHYSAAKRDVDKWIGRPFAYVKYYVV